MKALRLTISAVKNDIVINIIASILLSLLFFSEVSLYHFFYYNYDVVERRRTTDFTNATYSVSYEEKLSFDKLDELLDEMGRNIKNYEDVVVNSEIISDAYQSSELICFYKGISPLHRFRSELSSDILNDKVLNTGNVVGTNELGFFHDDENGTGDAELDSTYVIKGKKYRTICVHKLVNYQTPYKAEHVICMSATEFKKYSDGVYTIHFEYVEPLSSGSVNELKSYLGKYGTVKEFIVPASEVTKSVETIGQIAEYVIGIAVAMFVVTTCVLPIISYCLWKRRFEFASYRMCGASQGFISRCELIHVLLLGITAVILGTVLSYKNLQTKGFWLMLSFCTVIFLIRILIEAYIKSRASANVMEVKKKWRL